MIQSIDWTQVTVAIISVVGTILTGVLTYLFKTYAEPWLKSHNLTSLAEVAVNAAEAMIGSGNGEEKLKQALQFMADKGFDISSEDVLNAIEAQWNKLNISQIAAGLKDPEYDTYAEEDQEADGTEEDQGQP